MEFSARFATKSSSGSVINMKEEKIGMSAVCVIREQLGVNLPIEKISDTICKKVEKDLKIFLTEEQVQNILNINPVVGFMDTNSINVFVSDKYFNAGVCKKVYSNRNIIDDGISSAGIEYRINEEYIIEAWMFAGCPLEWTEDDTSDPIAIEIEDMQEPDNLHLVSTLKRIVGGNAQSVICSHCGMSFILDEKSHVNKS